jgi:general secretion pathway protein D
MVTNLTELMRNENVDTAMVRFNVIDSNNSVLAIAKTRSALDTVRRWVSRLEAAGSSRKRLHSYTMRFAQATQVAPMIARLLGAENAGEGSGQGAR